MPSDPREDDAPDDYTDATSTFGDRLGFAREAMGLSQAELARRIGVKSQTLRNWEEDRAEPRANKLQMLAGMLNAPMIWLMSGQGTAPAAGLAASASGGGAEDCLSELRRLRGEQASIV